MFFLREGIFECCSPASVGKPEFLSRERLVSSRPDANLIPSSSGSLNLYYQKWQSDRHQFVRAVVFVHSGETEHAAWYNALAVRFAAVGCTSFALDAQGFGQSDGARGYYEDFEEVVQDFVGFVKAKWAEVLNSQAAVAGGRSPALVLIAKGFGALVLMRALVQLHALRACDGATPVVVLLSPGFQFASFIGDQSNVSCGLNSGQCARQPVAQCARAPVAFAPAGDSSQPQKLEYMSHWFPKMIVTEPVDPEMVCRDPQAVERMCRDALIWRQGYRARVLANIVQEQSRLSETMESNPQVFQHCPCLILHGGGDKLFSVKGSQSVHTIWCHNAKATGAYPRMKIYDGAFHQLLNEPNKEEVINDIVSFVTSKVGNM
eukprot:TRINITY_DN23481_c0_g1_i1.p1 TRINITY_DN23481_c0_g1~~TRINITY_DN23481_c0_g1_i1.p1  ORF type:complete len:376 (-),score=67.96 TRINITY_DN23481_c0_g1_i1:183-1310(-)